LFVAIELSDRLKQALARVQRSLSKYDSVVRWVGPEQMHLTLKFIGEVADSRVSDISLALKQAAASAAPFEFQARGAGCFPPRGSVRIVWVGLEESTGTLPVCQRLVDENLAALGIEPEARPFSAHLTLGRVKDDATRGGLREAVEQVAALGFAQEVRSFALVSSVLTPNGARYTKVNEWRLGDRA
jgi:2'-5' RNA ligase